MNPLSLKLDCSNFAQSYFQIGGTIYDKENPNQINSDVTVDLIRIFLIVNCLNYDVIFPQVSIKVLK